MKGWDFNFAAEKKCVPFTLEYLVRRDFEWRKRIPSLLPSRISIMDAFLCNFPELEAFIIKLHLKIRKKKSILKEEHLNEQHHDYHERWRRFYFILFISMLFAARCMVGRTWLHWADNSYDNESSNLKWNSSRKIYIFICYWH